MLKSPLGRDQGFRILVNENKKRLYWHIRGMVLYHDDADDILQNTFVKVFRNIAKFKGDSALYTWMYRIATNESLSFLRSKASRMNKSFEELQLDNVSGLRSDPYFDGDQLEVKLQEAIVTLPEKQQQVFRMKYFQDMKYQEMSEILSTSVGALKASYHHARKKIEAIMINQLED